MLTVNCSVLVPGNSEDGHTSSDDDGEPFTSGLMSVLRGYTNAPKASAKAPAKRASAPKVAPKASQTKSRASTPASGTPSGISMKCPIGTVDGPKKKRKIESTETAPGLSLSDEMCDADREISQGFQSRLDDLRVVKPPLSEPQFKAHISDMISKCNTFMNDVKTKRRSSQRRSNKDDLLTANLDVMDDAMKEHVQILKCFLDNPIYYIGLSSFCSYSLSRSRTMNLYYMVPYLK